MFTNKIVVVYKSLFLRQIYIVDPNCCLLCRELFINNLYTYLLFKSIVIDKWHLSR